jgi:DNA-directed RNA polymerase specialized sigma24 family protein
MHEGLVMATSAGSHTLSKSLEALRDGSKSGPRFQDRLGEFWVACVPVVARRLRRFGLTDFERENAEAEVHMKLVVKAIHLDANRIHGFLAVVVQNAAMDQFRRRKHAEPAKGGLSDPIWWEELVAPATSESRLPSVASDARIAMARKAAERVRSRVNPKTWEVFEAGYQSEEPRAEVAERFGMTVDYVKKIVARIARLVKQEYLQLEFEAEIAEESGS